MSTLIAKDTGGGSNIPLIEADTYLGICYQIIHVGTIEDSFAGQKIKKNKIRMAWELPSEMYEFDQERGPEPRVVGKQYTLSLSEKANLRKDLVAWRGKEFTAEELKGFDVILVAGHACYLGVGIKTAKDGDRQYNLINSIARLPKAMRDNIPERTNDLLISNYNSKDKDAFFAYVWERIPNFIQKEMRESEEYQSCITAATKGDYSDKLAELVLATQYDEEEAEEADDKPKAKAAAKAKPKAKAAAKAKPKAETEADKAIEKAEADDEADDDTPF